MLSLGPEPDPSRLNLEKEKGFPVEALGWAHAGLVVASQLQISKNLKYWGPDLQNWKRIHFRWWGRGDIK